KGGHAISFDRVGGDTWTVTINNAEYEWHGDVRPVTAPEGKIVSVDLVPQKGAAVNFGEGSTGSGAQAAPPQSIDSTPIKDMVINTGAFTKYSDSYAYLRVGEDGSMQVHGNSYNFPTVNGQDVGPQEVPLRVGDDFRIKADVGDRYTVWQSF